MSPEGQRGLVLRVPAFTGRRGGAEGAARDAVAEARRAMRAAADACRAAGWSRPAMALDGMGAAASDMLEEIAHVCRPE